MMVIPNSSEDLFFFYVIETCGLHIFFSLFNVPSQSKIVMQAPGMCHILHKLTEPNTCVVFCLRDPLKIMQSQYNVEWRGEALERKKYTRPEYSYLPIGLAKYIEWFFHQRNELKIPYEEVYYDSFK